MMLAEDTQAATANSTRRLVSLHGEFADGKLLIGCDVGLLVTDLLRPRALLVLKPSSTSAPLSIPWVFMDVGRLRK